MCLFLKRLAAIIASYNEAIRPLYRIKERIKNDSQQLEIYLAKQELERFHLG